MTYEQTKENIEEQSNQAKARIAKYGLKAGMELRHKETKAIIRIVHIHSLYGWTLATDSVGCCPMLKQDLSNIDEFEKV